MMRTALSAEKYPSRDPQPFYDLVTYRLATQHATITALDEKIAQLFLLATALLAILAGVFAVDRSFDWEQIVLALIALAAYGFVVDRSVTAYRERTWDVGPSLKQVWDQMWNEQSDSVIRWSIAAALWKAHSNNIKSVQEKADALPGIRRGVLIQTALVIAALVLVAVEA